MEQTSKELLIKDLCYRLPYGVKVEAHGLLKTISDDYDNRGIINAHVLNGLNLKDFFKTYSIDYIEKVPLFNRKGECNIKPYLFPLSCMNEKQENEWNNLHFNPLYEVLEGKFNGKEEQLQLFSKSMSDPIQWCYKNHFDCNGLIPLGLAIDCTNLNIY